MVKIRTAPSTKHVNELQLWQDVTLIKMMVSKVQTVKVEGSPDLDWGIGRSLGVTRISYSSAIRP